MESGVACPGQIPGTSRHLLGFPIAVSIGLRGALRSHSFHTGASMGALRLGTALLRQLLQSRAAFEGRDQTRA